MAILTSNRKYYFAVLFNDSLLTIISQDDFYVTVVLGHWGYFWRQRADERLGEPRPKGGLRSL